MKHSILLKNRLAIAIGAAVLLLAFTISTIFSPGASASTATHLKDKKDAPKAVTVFGTVVGIKGDTLLLSNPKHSKKLIAVKITDNTIIFNKFTKKKMSLKDLKPKTSVVVEGHLNKNGSIKAKAIGIFKVVKKEKDKD